MLILVASFLGGVISASLLWLVALLSVPVLTPGTGVEYPLSPFVLLVSLCLVFLVFWKSHSTGFRASFVAGALLGTMAPAALYFFVAKAV